MTPGEQDERVVLTLDAGGTSFRFSALRGGQAVTDVLSLPSQANDLDRCLANIVEGFTRTKEQCPQPPVAISFAFPGPADYPNGIIGDPPNLPAFCGGVALGPMLQERFGIPVFINNDGDLFAYGEAIAGLLPQINDMLAKIGSPKRYRNLVGLTIGTGFGGGIVCGGELLLGDNSIAAEVWLLRNKLHPTTNTEEGASIRAVRRIYAEQSGIHFDQSPEPKVICDIATGASPGNQPAACEAFRQLGEVVGDALATVLTLIDGLVVIGGGISSAWPLFLPALINEINSTYTGPDGKLFRRLASVAFNLEDPAQHRKFLGGETRWIAIPGGKRSVKYDPLRRVGVGISRLGTSRAIAIGAYYFALRKLDGS